MFRFRKKSSPSCAAITDGSRPSWLGSIAVFYFILLALLSIPFVALLMIFFVRTVMNVYLWIFLGIGLLAAVAMGLVYWRRKKLRSRFKKDTHDVMNIIRAAAREGHQVNISFLHGLVRLDYQGGNRNSQLLAVSSAQELKALPGRSTSGSSPEGTVVADTAVQQNSPSHILGELEKLADLLDRGVVTEAEFQELKCHLLGSKRL
ncbi:MAG: SHOCT domain-containing protein [Deltaproteobacteria bacterium]|nr:SHOCT domain-containing protein [Deltaproteobacteria bacterium]MBW2072736.1 SHOCT domain-containing protein [Deltaproteobacteria bacterium]